MVEWSVGALAAAQALQLSGVRSTEPVPPEETAVEAKAEPEPEPEPAPEPEPEPVVETRSAAAAEPAPPPPVATTSPRDDPEADDHRIVVRPHAGHWGIQFTFGGLAPMSIAGLADYQVNRLMFSELGVRRMFRNGWALPFSAGVGVFNHNPDAGETQNDVGLSVSVGVRKYFRAWRRIAPYTGGDIRVAYLDPSGRSNWLVDLSFGPDLGIEFFFSDRASLLLQGDMSVGFGFYDGLVQTDFGTHVSGGGQTSLVFYF